VDFVKIIYLQNEQKLFLLTEMYICFLQCRCTLSMMHLKYKSHQCALSALATQLTFYPEK